MRVKKSQIGKSKGWQKRLLNVSKIGAGLRDIALTWSTNGRRRHKWRLETNVGYCDSRNLASCLLGIFHRNSLERCTSLGQEAAECRWGAFLGRYVEIMILNSTHVLRGLLQHWTNTTGMITISRSERGTKSSARSVWKRKVGAGICVKNSYVLGAVEKKSEKLIWVLMVLLLFRMSSRNGQKFGDFTFLGYMECTTTLDSVNALLGSSCLPLGTDEKVNQTVHSSR